jgi:Raf kinase inhibitor-like YbhB/YbcL family protein
VVCDAGAADLTVPFCLSITAGALEDFARPTVAQKAGATMQANHRAGSRGGADVAVQQPGIEASASIQVRSSAFEPGQRIPERFTAYDEGISPPLGWNGVPAGTRSLVLIMEDPDAPMREPFVHWLMYNIPPETTSLPEGIPGEPRLDDPPGALQGVNSRGSIGYFGPRDPPHHYHFQIFALDTKLRLPPGVDRPTLAEAMSGHVLAKGELVGRCRRRRTALPRA